MGHKAVYAGREKDDYAGIGQTRGAVLCAKDNKRELV
jgi:hypothetical protein